MKYIELILSKTPREGSDWNLFALKAWDPLLINIKLLSEILLHLSTFKIIIYKISKIALAAATEVASKAY